MTVEPAPDQYQPTQRAACDEEEVPFEFPAETFGEAPAFLERVDHRHVLVSRQLRYKGKIEDFALQQLLYVDAVKHEVARIDCCRGTIHWHLSSASGKVLVDHGLIQVIPPRPEGVQVVDAGYGEMWDRMIDGWLENLRRWHRGE